MVIHFLSLVQPSSAVAGVTILAQLKICFSQRWSDVQSISWKLLVHHEVLAFFMKWMDEKKHDKYEQFPEGGEGPANFFVKFFLTDMNNMSLPTWKFNRTLIVKVFHILYAFLRRSYLGHGCHNENIVWLQLAVIDFLFLLCV